MSQQFQSFEKSVEITASFKNISDRKKTLHVMNTTDETWRNTEDERSGMSVTGTHFDKHSLTNYKDSRTYEQ